MMWTLRDLYEHGNSTSTEIRPGVWVPARPMNYKVEGVWLRLKHAWAVLRGKAEAFTWPEGQ